MKKITFIILLSLIASAISAQREYLPRELSFSYGLGAYNLPQTIYTRQGFGPYDLSKMVLLGTYSGGYTFYLSEKFGIGVVFSFLRIDADLLLRSNYTHSEGDFRETHSAVIPNIKYNWVTKNFFSIYSRGGIGFYSMKTSYNIAISSSESIAETRAKTYVAWQVSPLGIEIGPPAVACFIEGGYGYMGMVQFGMRFRF